jgi:hypothetical protein
MYTGILRFPCRLRLCPRVDARLCLCKSARQHVRPVLACSDALLQPRDVSLLGVEVVEAGELPRDILDQLLRVRLEVVVQLFGQAGELLQRSDGLAQHRDLLEDGVVCVVEAARRPQRLVRERLQSGAEVSDRSVSISHLHGRWRAERCSAAYLSLASTLFRSSSTSSGRSGFRGGIVMPTSFPLESAPSPPCTLPLRLWLGLVSLLPRACFSKSPKLAGGCSWMADCTTSRAWRRLELWRSWWWRCLVCLCLCLVGSVP